MALNTLANELENLVNNTGANEPTPAPAPAETKTDVLDESKKTGRPAKPGDNYKWDKENNQWVALTPEEVAKKAASLQKRTENTAVYNNLITRSQANKVSETKKALKKAMSSRARIVAYVTNTDSKFEITAKKSGTSYNLGVVNKAPSSIKAVVITIPAVLDTLKARVDSGEENAEILNQLQIIAATREETPALKIIVKPWEEFARFLQNECAGYLHEDDAIFATYTAKNKKTYRNPADIDSKDNMPSSGSYVYLKFTTNAKAARTYSIKHSIRAKILAPGNYVSLKKWVTDPLLASYSDADAALRIRAHLGRFCVGRKSKNGETHPAIITQLSAEAATLVDVVNGNIAATAFFPAGEKFRGKAWINSAAAKGVAHWYNKNESDGCAATVAPSEISLVSKPEKLTSTGKTKIAAEFVMLKLAAASDASYKFDAATFPQIIKALRGHENEAFEAIFKETKKTRATTSKSKSKSGTKFKSYANSGEDVANLTLEDIQAILSKS